MKPILLVIALQLAATSYVAMCSPVVSDECGRLSRRAAPLRPPVDDTQKSDCVAFNYTYCNDMGHSNGWGSYSYASFPNGRQQTQPQCAIDEIADFNTLLQSTDQCSTKLGTLLCFYYFPWCDPNTVMADSYGKLVHLHVLPCRSVCEEVRRDCRASLEALGQTWPRHLNCSDTRIFPIPGAGGLGSPIQCTTGSQLTTTDDPSASSDSPSVTPVTPTNPIGTREPEVPDCGNLTSPANGSVEYQSTTVGSEATYHCDNGYSLVGDSRVVCQNDGMWSGEQPTCVVTDCGSPLPPADGSVEYGTTTVGSEATYHCDSGYSLVGDSHAVCQSDGMWSGEQPTCVIADCGSPPSPAHGSVEYQTTTFGSEATYQCDEDYSLVGDSLVVCQSDGMWGEEPSCQSTCSCRPGCRIRPKCGANTFRYNDYTFAAHVELLRTSQLPDQGNLTFLVREIEHYLPRELSRGPQPRSNSTFTIYTTTCQSCDVCATVLSLTAHSEYLFAGYFDSLRHRYIDTKHSLVAPWIEKYSKRRNMENWVNRRFP